MKWVNVDDRLPESGEHVLGFCSDGIIECKAYDGRLNSIVFASHGCGCCSEDDIITHWMPLPEPPTLENTNAN